MRSKSKVVSRKWKGGLERGYTLIEILAVIVVFGVVGTMVFGILTTTLQSSNKTEGVTTVQQNGNYVLSLMTRMIRYSKRITYPTSCYPGPTPTPIDNTSIAIENLDGNITTFSCDGLPSGTIASNGASLLDTQSVAVTACTFSCNQTTPYDVPSVTIDFTLNKKNSNNLVENNSPIQFQTTVTLRNLTN
jgi:prepilin-type N-terminal cleavage/methylation domain-containing protein